MKNIIKVITAVLFLLTAIPYTFLLLVNGRNGIHREEELTQCEYEILSQMIQEDFSWMEDETLDLMAILFRTQWMENSKNSDFVKPDMPWEEYDRIYQAVVRTQGQVIQIDRSFRELPYHKVSAGMTRSGELLGPEYDYVRSAACPEDLMSEDYLSIYYLTEKEFLDVFQCPFSEALFQVQRDSSDYVVDVQCETGQWSGEQVRTMLHLPSSCFWMEQMPDGRIRITVRGNGHGMGISLFTANEMVKSGCDLPEILDKFYEGAECITLP